MHTPRIGWTSHSKIKEYIITGPSFVLLLAHSFVKNVLVAQKMTFPGIDMVRHQHHTTRGSLETKNGTEVLLEIEFSDVDIVGHVLDFALELLQELQRSRFGVLGVPTEFFIRILSQQ